MLNREPMGMKRDARRRRDEHNPVSVLNREPMGMKHTELADYLQRAIVSVLNREPMGMKPGVTTGSGVTGSGFSAQPRADGDEADSDRQPARIADQVSVLNREPMGMKPMSLPR